MENWFFHQKQKEKHNFMSRKEFLAQNSCNDFFTSVFASKTDL